MKDYSTVLEAIDDLKKRGYTYDFNLTNNALKSSDGDIVLSPDDFNIIAVHRFEGPSDPADNSIVYAIESTVKDIKGTFVDAYGVYSNTISQELLKKLSTTGIG